MKPKGFGYGAERMSAQRAELDPRRLTRWVGAFVVLGLALRIVRYLVNYPIWHDEAFVAVNFLHRGYLDLLRPLDYSQVCPLLFLWIELTMVKLGGYTEWSLRAFPTFCALASVLLFWGMSRRLLDGLPHLLAVAIFAISFTPIRHGGEIKPYASDLFAALVLFRLVLAWYADPRSSRWLWWFAASSPFMLGLSNPAIFVASGLCLAMAPSALRSPNPRVRVAFIVCNISVLFGFIAIYAAFTSAQSAQLTDYYRWGYWLDSFPPIARPWLIPWWLLWIHLGKLMAYPIGGESGASIVTFACVLIGVTVLWRQGRRAEVGLLCAPFGMGLLAAFLGRYPYGGEARFMQYLAPSTCLLMGLGLAWVIERRADLLARRRLYRGVVLTLAFIGVTQLVLDFIKPYRDKEDIASRRFAQRLWNDEARGAELVCARTDLGLRLETNPLKWDRGMSSIYLCYQGLYSPRCQQKRPPDFRAVSETHPLRIVFFDRPPSDHPYYGDWLKQVSREYDLRLRSRYVVFPPKTKESWKQDGCVVLEFVPSKEGGHPKDPDLGEAIARRNTFLQGRF